MATLDQILADVASENTTITSVQTLISGLQTQLSAAPFPSEVSHRLYD